MDCQQVAYGIIGALGGLLTLSEGLALLPQIKSNSVLQVIVNVLIAAAKNLKQEPKVPVNSNNTTEPLV